MNEIEKRTILLIAENHKNMCVGIGTFADFLTPIWYNTGLNPITDVDVLKTGFYAYLLKCKIWVSKQIAPDSISFSDLDISNSSEMEKWSPQVLIKNPDEYARIINMKVFM